MQHQSLKQAFILLFLMGYSFYGMAQVQPFSRKDSVLLLQYQEKFERADQHQRYKEAADNLNETAYLYWDHNDYKKAIEFYEKSLTYNQKLGNENAISMISSNLGMLYYDIEESDTALKYFGATLASRRANKEKVGVIEALINISVVKNKLKRYDQSLADLEEALSIAREINDLERMRSCYGMLAETYQKAGNVEKSLYYFEYYRSFQELSQKKKIENIEVALREERTKKEKIEGEHQALSRKLSERKGEINSLNAKIKEADTTLSKLNLELESKNVLLKLVQQEKEILALKAEKEEELLLQERTKQQNRLIISIIVIAFLVALIAMILTADRRIKAKNRLLSMRNREILSINTELKNTNRIKDILFSVIGHDLRSPLGQLEQTFDLVDNDMLDEEEKAMFFKEVRKGLKRSNLLLENLLAWANSQMNGKTMKIKPFGLNDAVEESLFILESLYRSKKINLVKEFDFEGAIKADEDMVKMIVRNLASNAIKFTHQEGIVNVKTGREGDFACIKVEDNGVGMNQKQIDGLFDSGKNDSTYGTNKEKGTGIGLKLCKEFIDTMKGQIKIESFEGKGTSFSVLIPLT